MKGSVGEGDEETTTAVKRESVRVCHANEKRPGQVNFFLS